MIPKKIYYTLPNKNLLNVKEINDKLILNNDNYEQIFYDDNDCLRFIKKHYPYDVYLCYCQIIPGAFKADFWRLCILYKYGGIYIDLGLKIIDDLDNIIQDKKLILVKDRHSYGIFNAFICSIPKHPFIKYCIENLCYKINRFDYGDNPLDFSGPLFLQKMFDNWIFKDTIYFYFHNEDGSSINSIDNNTIIYTKNDERIYKSKFYKNKICLFRKQFTDSIGDKIESYHYDILWENKIVFYNLYYGSWNKSATNYYISNGYLFSKLKNNNNNWIQNKIELKPFQKYCNNNGKFIIED